MRQMGIEGYLYGAALSSVMREPSRATLERWCLLVNTNDCNDFVDGLVAT